MSSKRATISRRELLRGAGALAGAVGLGAFCGEAGALGSRSKVQLAQLRYAGGNPIPRASGLQRLAWELDKRTSIDVATQPLSVDLGAKAMFRHPFVYLGGDRAFPLPSAEKLAALRRHLTFGGFLLIDSAEARPGGDFDKSARALVAALFPKDPLRKVKRKKSVLHRSFYLLDDVVGRVATVPYLEAVERHGRAAVVYCQDDLAGAWARDNFGQWEHSVYPGGAHQRELAFRWGINLVMYALCVDYKADQVHIPFILKRRRWQIR